ncbi:MAG: tetratricopeptide repeat protein [Pseudomonadota bacterium]
MTSLKAGGSRRVLALCLAVTMGLAACDSVEDRIEEHLSRAQELTIDGEAQKAIIEYRNVLQLKGDHVEARLGIAQLLEEQGNFQAAIGHYLVAVDNDGGNVEARVRLAQYMLITGQLDRALELSEQAYELQPRDADVLAVRGSVAYQMDEREFAVELASRAVEIEPTHPSANVVLITDRVDNQDIETALAMNDGVLEVHGDDLSLQLLKLRLLEIAGRPDAALGQLELIVDSFPDVTSARRALAAQYLQRGDLDKSEAQFRAIVDQAPDELPAKLDVVRFIYQTQGTEEAVTELQAMSEAAEEPWPFQEALAQLFEESGQPEKSRALMTEIVDSGSGNVLSAKVKLAQYRLADREIADAEVLIDEVLASDTQNVDALAMRGALQLDRDQYEDAIETLRVALANQPDDVRLLLLSGRAHLLNGNDALGADQLATATRASEYSPAITQEYVRYLLQRSRVDAAEAVLGEAARRHPDNSILLSALAELRLRQQDWGGAEAVAAQLRELQDGGTTAEQVLAASLSGQQRFAESAEILRGLSGDNRQTGSTLPALVQNLVAADRGDEARSTVEQTLAADPDNFQARMLEASLAQSNQGASASIQLFEQILDDFPDRAEIYFIMYRIRIAQERVDDAMALLKTGVERTENTRLRLLLASEKERQGAFDDAIAEYEAIFEAEPQSLIAANNLASMLSVHRSDDPGQLERAVRIAKRLRGTEVPEMQDTLGWTLYLGGEYQEARSVLEEAVEGLPNNPYVNYHLGMTYSALELTEEARQHLDRALELAQGTPFPHTDKVRAALENLPAPEAGSGQ